LYPQHNKYEVYVCFVKFKNLVQIQFTCRIKNLQSD